MKKAGEEMEEGGNRLLLCVCCQTGYQFISIIENLGGGGGMRKERERRELTVGMRFIGKWIANSNQPTIQPSTLNPSPPS